MAMLPQTSPSLRPTAYQPPTTTKVVRVRPSSTSGKTRKRVSEAEYWEKYYHDRNDHQYEWNNGYLEEKPMPDYVSYLMYDWLVTLLKEYLKAQPLAKIIGLEMGFRLHLLHKIAIRKPDLGVVLNSNPVPLAPRDLSYQGIFDLCLESLSYSKPSEVKRDTVLKKREYAKGGVKEYYILDTRGKRTVFYQLTTRGIYQPIKPTPDGLIRSQVLPGFQFRLTDLQRQPSLEQMSEDPVYRPFVLLALQAAKRAQQEAEGEVQQEKAARRKETDARQLAEAQAQAEREARCKETEARQLAEAQAQAEKEARQRAEAQAQAAETKLRQLEAELARVRQSP